MLEAEGKRGDEGIVCDSLNCGKKKQMKGHEDKQSPAGRSAYLLVAALVVLVTK